MAEYYIWHGAAGANNGSSWANAFTSLYAALSAVAEADDDVFYIASDHNELTSNNTITSNAHIRLISVNRTTMLPEVGAVVRIASISNIIINGRCYCHGVSFKSTQSIIRIGFNNSHGSLLIFDACLFELPNLSGLACYIGHQNIGVEVVFKNSALKFGHSSQSIQLGSCKLKMSNLRIDDSGVAPNIVFKPNPSPSVMADMQAFGCDFSHATALYNASSTNPNASRMLFKNCLVPATKGSGTHPGPGNAEYELHACGTVADDHAYQYHYQGGAGAINYNTGVYKDGGTTFSDTDGTDDAMSLMMVSSAHAGKHNPLYSPWFNVLISSTGSQTLSIDIAHELAGVMKDNEAWLEIEYMGDADNPLTTLALSAPVVPGSESLDMLATGSDLTDTDAAWTGLTGEITHTLSKSVTINQQGFARVRVALAKASSTVYVDPQVTVS